MEQQKTKVSECSGQKRLCNLCNHERGALGRTQAQKLRDYQTEQRKDPINVDPLDLSIALRTEGTTVQMCGDSNVAKKWINGHFAMGQK